MWRAFRILASDILIASGFRPDLSCMHRRHRGRSTISAVIRAAQWAMSQQPSRSPYRRCSARANHERVPDVEAADVSIQRGGQSRGVENSDDRLDYRRPEARPLAILAHVAEHEIDRGIAQLR